MQTTITQPQTKINLIKSPRTNSNLFPSQEEDYEEYKSISESMGNYDEEETEETEAEEIARIQSTPLTSREKMENLADIFEGLVDHIEIGDEVFLERNESKVSFGAEKRQPWGEKITRDKENWNDLKNLIIQVLQLENERENIELDFSLYAWE